MANLSDETRKEQILSYLTSHKGEWVDGTEIMNEAVGGQRGGARIKELRDDGVIIFARKHPDPARDIWQYQLVDPPKPSTPIRSEAAPAPHVIAKGPMVFGRHRICTVCHAMRKACASCGGKGYIEAQPGT